MIELVTNKGISLDLDREQDIQIEMEQPLLDSEHLPVAYSTQINFPLSDTNKSVFGYVPAMMLEPTVKEIEASILFSGVEIFSGSLVYDGMEDGMLRYIFTEKGLEEKLESDIAPSEDETATYEEMMTQGNKYRMPIIADKEYARFYVWPFDGQSDDYDHTEADIKFRNFARKLPTGDWIGESRDYDHSCSFLPCVRVLSLVRFIDTSAFSYDGDNIIEKLYMLLPYGSTTFASYPPTRSGFEAKGEHFGIIKPENFPKATASDIVKNLCSMVCAAVFKSGTGYILYPSRALFHRDEDNHNVLFWDEKISDIYSLSVEPGKNYDFEMGTDAIEGEKTKFQMQETNPYNILDINNQDTHIKVNYLVSSLDAGNIVKIISTRSHPGTVWENPEKACRLYDSEIVYRNNGVAINDAGKDEEFEVKCDFKTVPTVPERIIFTSDVNGLEVYDFMAPHFEMPDPEDGRGGDLFVGIMVEQDHDKNYLFGDGTPLPNLVEHDILDQFSLLPGYLYEEYHRDFARWMGTDRPIVKAELSLTLEDLLSVALYKRVNFRGRDWMIKKLSLTLRTGSEAFEATGEFISLP